LQEWLEIQTRKFFSNKITILVDRWTKCFEKQGDYIEIQDMSNYCEIILLKTDDKFAFTYICRTVHSENNCLLRM
jgi:hypothetical protein